MAYIVVKDGVSLMGTPGSWIMTRSNGWSPSMENAATYRSKLTANAAANVARALNYGSRIRVMKV